MPLARSGESVNMRGIVCLLCLAAATMACGHGGGGLSPSSVPGIVVSDAIGVPHVFEIGRTYRLTATLQRPGQADEDVTTASQWTSSNNSVATVTGNVARIQALGDVDITATYRSAAGTFHISVTAGELIFQFSPLVSPSDQQLIRDGIADGLSNFASTFGWSPTGKLTINVSGGASPGATAGTSRNEIRVFTGSSTWNGSSDDGKRRIMRHELFHVLQITTGWIGVPFWLVEGAADYVAFHIVIIDRGVATADAVRACHQQYVEANPVTLPSLQALENQQFYDGTRAPYSLGYLAADQLVGTRGLPILMSFGTSIDASGFLPAFEASFGRPLTAFYAEFEQYRQSWPAASASSCGAWF